jgi:hypothetical protein
MSPFCTTPVVFAIAERGRRTISAYDARWPNHRHRRRSARAVARAAHLLDGRARPQRPHGDREAARAVLDVRGHDHVPARVGHDHLGLGAAAQRGGGRLELRRARVDLARRDLAELAPRGERGLGEGVERVAAHPPVERHEQDERRHHEGEPAHEGQRGREALDAWVRTPAPLPRMQHETVVRLLAGDLVEPGAITEGLQGLRVEVEEALASLEVARGRHALFPTRADLLRANDRYAEKLLRLQLEWLDDAEATLKRHR